VVGLLGGGYTWYKLIKRNEDIERITIISSNSSNSLTIKETTRDDYIMIDTENQSTNENNDINIDISIDTTKRISKEISAERNINNSLNENISEVRDINLSDETILNDINNNSTDILNSNKSTYYNLTNNKPIYLLISGHSYLDIIDGKIWGIDKSKKQISQLMI